MQGLTSNIELSDTLKDVATSLSKNDADFGQKLSVGASYIGQTVTLDDSTVGVVDRAFLAGDETFVGINGVDVPISRVVSVNSSQSYVGELVAADVGNGVTELGTVRGVDNSGAVQTSEIDADSIANVLSLKEIEGKQVQAVTANGQVLSGTAIAAEAAGTTPKIFVQGISVGLDRVVGVN